MRSCECREYNRKGGSFLDKRVLELVSKEVDQFSITCHFKIARMAFYGFL